MDAVDLFFQPFGFYAGVPAWVRLAAPLTLLLGLGVLVSWLLTRWAQRRLHAAFKALLLHQLPPLQLPDFSKPAPGVNVKPWRLAYKYWDGERTMFFEVEAELNPEHLHTRVFPQGLAERDRQMSVARGPVLLFFTAGEGCFKYYEDAGRNLPTATLEEFTPAPAAAAQVNL